jgi:hypothetical protein
MSTAWFEVIFLVFIGLIAGTTRSARDGGFSSAMFGIGAGIAWAIHLVLMACFVGLVNKSLYGKSKRLSDPIYLRGISLSLNVLTFLLPPMIYAGVPLTLRGGLPRESSSKVRRLGYLSLLLLHLVYITAAVVGGIPTRCLDMFGNCTNFAKDFGWLIIVAVLLAWLAVHLWFVLTTDRCLVAEIARQEQHAQMRDAETDDDC